MNAITAGATAPDILDRAAGHLRQRAGTYDKPEGERSMAQTVAIFNLHHGTALTEAQGWHMMQILKDVRLFTRAGFHADSAEDCTAYSALKAEAKAREVTPVANDNIPYPSMGRCNGSTDGRCIHTSAPCVKGCSTRA